MKKSIIPRQSIKVLFICACFFFNSVFPARAVPEAVPDVYAVAEDPTPVFNVSDPSLVFGGEDGKTLHRDGSGLIREVEFIALPGTVFKIKRVIKKGSQNIYEVTSREYPYPSKNGYFIDRRFLRTFDHKVPERIKRLPDKKVIMKNLISAEGSAYVWGGNVKDGIPQMLSFYPPRQPISPKVKEQWMLKGVDCSGLLYEATGGVTPRNTSTLVDYGEEVKIMGLTEGQIIQKLRPLDLIVWKGHVIIVLDGRHTIESRLNYGNGGEPGAGGVKIRNIETVLSRLLQKRTPVNVYSEKSVEKPFVIRRWYKDPER